MRLCVSLCLVASVLITGCAPITRPEPPNKEASAASAAPAVIGAAATILDYAADLDSAPPLLRAGSNGWTCFPDAPWTPINDPMCLDAAWMAFYDAFLMGAEPHHETVGLAYMLQGGADASTTDPTLMEPPPGQDWILSGPHIMLIAPGGFDSAIFSTDPKNGGPWIMFDGTPYEYLMVPTVSAPATSAPLTFGRMVAEATAVVSGFEPVEA